MAPSRSHSFLILRARCEWLKSARVVDCDPYYKYSAMYHLEGLPPLCLLHGVDDELAPFSQSVQLAAVLDLRDRPYALYAQEGLGHHFPTL